MTPFEVGDHIDNKFLHATVISVRNRNGIGKGCVLKCDKCGYEFSEPYSQILKGVGCGACSGRILVKGINDIPTTTPWMVKYFPGGLEEASNYTCNTIKKKFIPICPFCGRLADKQMSPNQIYTKHGMSCICKDGISKPNKIIRAVMDRLLDLKLIKFRQKEYPIIDMHNTERKYDMYFETLDGNKYFVEMDGGLHGYIIRKHEYKDKKFVFMSAKLFYADAMKDEAAERMGIPLIRIDCYKSNVEYIKKQMEESQLSEIVNLDLIDWDVIEEICCSSLLKEICQYRNDHPDLFAQSVADVFDVSNTTVRNYWKQGAKLELCDYDPQKEFNRRNSLKHDWYQNIPLYVENLDTLENWIFTSKTEFSNLADDYLDGDKMTKSMLEKRFSKLNSDYFIYDSGIHEYLIWQCKEE